MYNDVGIMNFLTQELCHMILLNKEPALAIVLTATNLSKLLLTHSLHIYINVVSMESVYHVVYVKNIFATFNRFGRNINALIYGILPIRSQFL